MPKKRSKIVFTCPPDLFDSVAKIAPSRRSKIFKTLKKGLLYLLSSPFIFSFSLIIGILAGYGFFVISPILVVALVFFGIAALVEGIGVGTSYFARFFERFTNPGQYKCQILEHALTDLNPETLANPQLKAFLTRYQALRNNILQIEHYLSDYYGTQAIHDTLARLKRQKSKIERAMINQIEHPTNVQNSQNNQTDEMCAQFEWDIAPIQKAIKHHKIATLIGLLSGSLAGTGFFFGTSAFLGLGSATQSTFFVHLLAYIGVGGVLSALGPIGIGLILACAAIFYGIMVYQAVINLTQSPYVLEKWRTLKKCWKGEDPAYTDWKIRAKVITINALLLLITISFTVLTVGNLSFQKAALGLIFMVIYGLGSFVYKLNALLQTAEALFGGTHHEHADDDTDCSNENTNHSPRSNLLRAPKQQPFSKAKKGIGHKLKTLLVEGVWKKIKTVVNRTGEAISITWNKEGGVEFFNPFRAFKNLLMETASNILFWAHFFPVATIGDRFSNYPMSTTSHIALGLVTFSNDCAEDFGPYFLKSNAPHKKHEQPIGSPLAHPIKEEKEEEDVTIMLPNSLSQDDSHNNIHPYHQQEQEQEHEHEHENDHHHDCHHNHTLVDSTIWVLLVPLHLLDFIWRLVCRSGRFVCRSGSYGEHKPQSYMEYAVYESACLAFLGKHYYKALEEAALSPTTQPLDNSTKNIIDHTHTHTHTHTQNSKKATINPSNSPQQRVPATKHNKPLLPPQTSTSLPQNQDDSVVDPRFGS